jgi:hypothetical protein
MRNEQCDIIVEFSYAVEISGYRLLNCIYDRVDNKLHQDEASHMFNMAVGEMKDLRIHLLFSNLAKPTKFIHSC